MTRNEKARISAHYNCLFFTPGGDMIQDFQRTTPEESLEGFAISAIEACISNHEKIKCCFCQKPGAVSTCANKKCKKTGWYHFPCGLKNGSVQEDVKTFCYKCANKKNIDAKDRGRRKSVSDHKALSSPPLLAYQEQPREDLRKKSGLKETKPETDATSNSKGKRKRAHPPPLKTTLRRVSEDKVTGEPIWVATSDSDSSLSLSQSSQEDDDHVENTEDTLAGAGEVFDNWLNLRLRPIDCLDILEPGQPRESQDYSIYNDNAEDDEDAAVEDSRIEDSDDGSILQLTEDLSTSIDLKYEFPGETVDSGTDSGHVSQAQDEGKIIRRLSLYLWSLWSNLNV